MATTTTLVHNYQTLKPTMPDAVRLRVHRALSWLEQAERTTDLDTRFIFLWIAFNAIYAKDFSGVRGADKGLFTEFLHRISQLDSEQRLYDLVWQTYSGSIRILLDNRYTFQPFWDYHNGVISEAEWQASFEQNKQRALTALADKNTVAILNAVFAHLYTLRNQIVHGGATHGSSVNRAQLKDACRILGDILPAMIEIVMMNADQEWGKPFYPVVD